jgi:hypothetical protein
MAPIPAIGHLRALVSLAPAVRRLYPTGCLECQEATRRRGDAATPRRKAIGRAPGFW